MEEESVLGGLESEFQAKFERVNIIPSFSGPKLTFIEGNVGPFTAGRSCTVPLWLALQMRAENKCTIQTPDWMELEALKARLRDERQEEKSLRPLPYHYIQIAHLILTSAPSDVPNAEEVKSTVDLLQKMRFDKVNRILETLNVDVATKLTGISSMELNMHRILLLKAMGAFRAIRASQPMQQQRPGEPGAADSALDGSQARPLGQRAAQPLRRFHT